MSQLYLTGALASAASASVVQQINGQTTGHDNADTFYENLSLGLSPSAEYMLATTLYGTGAFDGYGAPYQPALLVYQSSSASGYGIVEEIHLKGYYDLDNGNIRYDAGKNLTAAQFISNTEILHAGGQLDLDNTGQGGTEATQGYFMQITGSGNSWGIHNYLTGNTSHTTTAQSRGVNGSQANVIGRFGVQSGGTQIKTNNRFGSAAPTRAASFFGFMDSNGAPENVVTCFQSSSGDGWTFHSQFGPADLTAPGGSAFGNVSSLYVKDVAWISETEMVIIYHHYATSNAKSHRLVLEYVDDEWRVTTTGITINNNTYYRHELSNAMENEILHGRSGHRFVEYDDVNEKVWVWYTQANDVNVEQYASGSGWLQKFYPTGNNNQSHSPDSKEDFDYAPGPSGDGHTREYAWASLKNSQMWVDSNGNMSAISLFGPSSDSYLNDHLSSLVYAESGSSGFNHSLSVNNPLVIRSDQVLNADTLLSGALSTPAGGIPVAQQYPGGLNSDGGGHQFAWNSLYGGDGNTLIYKEGASSGQTPGRLAVVDLNAFPASNPSLDDSVSETVGSSGGTVRAGGTQNSPKVTVTIPENALGANTSITANVEESNNQGLYAIDAGGDEALSPLIRLTPHGQIFSSPVTISFSLEGSAAGTCPSNLQIWKRNTETSSWYLLPSNLYSCSSGTITVTTTRFSDMLAIGGKNMARTKLNNIQIARLEDSNMVLAESLNITGSGESYILTTQIQDDSAFIIQSGGFAAPVSASALATYFASETGVNITEKSDNTDYRIVFVDSSDNTQTALLADSDAAHLKYNPSSNTLTVAGTVSGGTLTDGTATITGGAIAAVTTVSGSGQFSMSHIDLDGTLNAGGKVTVVGVSDLDGGIDVNGSKFTVSTAGAVVADSTVSGAAGTFDALAGTSLALQSGGITAAGAIAGATTIAASSNATIEGIVSGAAGTFDALGGTSLALQNGGITNAGAIAGATTIDASGDLTVGSITNAEFTVDASGNTDIDGTLNVEGVPTFQAGAVFSAGITTANAIAGATTISGSGVISGLSLDIEKGADFNNGGLTNAGIISGVSQLTASHARVTNLDVVTINSITQTETTLEVSDKLIVSSLSGSASDSDGGGLQIGGGANSTGHASVLWSDGDDALDLNIGSSTVALVKAAGFEVAGTVSGSGQLTAHNISAGQGALTVSQLGIVSGSTFFDMVKDKLRIDGQAVTTTAAELNKLDGVTATTTELNYVDVTTIGTVDASKAVVVNSDKDVTGFRSLTASANIVANAFFGDGSGLSGVGAQVAATDDSTPSGAATLPLVFTSGAASAANLFVDPGELSFNPGTNALYVTGALTAGGAIAAEGNISTSGSVTAGSGVAANGAISAATTVSGSGTFSMSHIDLDGTLNAGGKVTVVGVSDLDGGIDVNGSKFTVSTAGAVVADSTVSGAAGTFDALAGTSLALQNGGITAAGAIAGATTIDASGDLTVGSITNAEFTVDASGNTDIDGTLNVEGVPTFQAGAVFSAGVTTANAIAGATTISGSGQLTVHNISAGQGAATITQTGIVSSSTFFDAIKDKLRIDGQAVTTTAAELNIVDGNTSAASVTLVNTDGVVVNDGGTMKQALVSDFATYLASDGLTISSNKIVIDYVEDIATKYQRGSILTANGLTASLSQTPLDDSLQVYLNGMLLVQSGSAEISSSAGGIEAIFDYKYVDAGGSDQTVIFAQALDDDDVIQLKYIKK